MVSSNTGQDLITQFIQQTVPSGTNESSEAKFVVSGRVMGISQKDL